jgi:hypothetical protein
MVEKFFVGCEQGAAEAEEEDGRWQWHSRECGGLSAENGPGGGKIKEMAFIPYDNGSTC